MSIKKKKAEKGKTISAPPIGRETSEDKEPPVFCFRHLQKDFCISDCQKDEKAALADKLREMSRLTWEQLRQAGRHGQGYERISRDAIKAPIPPILTDDVNIIAFRFFGKAPVVGFRFRRIFHVLWLDTKFKLYNHG